MEKKNLLYCAMMLMLSSSCINNADDKLNFFETQDGRASIVIKNKKLYYSPVIENGLIDKGDVGRKILYYRNKENEVICHNFGHGFIIANFKRNSEKCFGWRFEKRNAGNEVEYISYCDDKYHCVDEVFRKRPFLRYYLTEASELIRFRFDPTYGDSIDYLKKGDEKYLIE